MDFKLEYNAKKEIIDNALDLYMPKVDSRIEKITEAMKYSVNAGGKRIRPILMLATCEMCGGDINDAIPYACALEFIHTYSLIHDDLPAIDNDDYRRGKLTSHKVFGEDIAILAGDGLLNSAGEIIFNDIANSNNDKLTSYKILAGKEIFTSAGCLGMIGGQVADIDNNKVSDLETLDFINLNKTSKLIKASVKVGALLAGAEESVVNELEKAATNIGLAFQIQDDILDVIGNEEKMGKSVGSDSKLNKFTYVELVGLEKSKEVIAKLTDEAQDIINKYNDKNEFLKQLLEFLTKRDY